MTPSLGRVLGASYAVYPALFTNDLHRRTIYTFGVRKQSILRTGYRGNVLLVFAGMYLQHCRPGLSRMWMCVSTKHLSSLFQTSA